MLRLLVPSQYDKLRIRNSKINQSSKSKTKELNYWREQQNIWQNAGPLLFFCLIKIVYFWKEGFCSVGEMGSLLHAQKSVSEKKGEKYCLRPQSSILLYHIRTIGLSISLSLSFLSLSPQPTFNSSPFKKEEAYLPAQQALRKPS